jgi:hypothetical protein
MILEDVMKISKEFIREMQEEEFESFRKTKYYSRVVICAYSIIILIVLLIGIGIYELVK